MIPLPELAQHWVRYKVWLVHQDGGLIILRDINRRGPFKDAHVWAGFMVWLMEDLSNER
jgi:hypothetical protein